MASKDSGVVGWHRADDLRVRRWLQLGAASAGMGAALIGWSLVGSEMGVASADGGVASSSSAGPTASPSTGVDSGSAATSSSGRDRTNAPHDDDATDAEAGAPLRTARTAPATARSHRVAAAESTSAADDDANTTIVTSRLASRAATPDDNPPGPTQNNVTTSASTAQLPPAAAIADEVPETLQDNGIQFPAGAAGTIPVATAGNRDGVRAIGRFALELVKKALNSKTLLNPVQQLDGKVPGLVDLIPKIRLPGPDSWTRETQAREQERRDARSREISDIMKNGRKLTASDGSPVYTTDGKNFVKYAVTGWTSYGTEVNAHPAEPVLTRLPRQGRRAPWRSIEDFEKRYEQELNNYIRNDLKLDPALVRSLWGKPLTRGVDTGGGAS